MLRLFVALHPPPESAVALLSALPAAARAHRVTPTEQVHMTLFFLGNTGPRELRDVRESVERSVAGVKPFELTPQRLVTLPERGPPRVYAVQTDRPPGLMEIQRRLVQRLVRRPGTSADNRFLPHLTLSRVKEGEPAEPVDSPLAGSPFPVRSIGLIRSVLGPGGARHEMIERFELAG